MRVDEACPTCQGTGRLYVVDILGITFPDATVDCGDCGGTGSREAQAERQGRERAEDWVDREAKALLDGDMEAERCAADGLALHMAVALRLVEDAIIRAAGR
jgi:hypothetical protein